MIVVDPIFQHLVVQQAKARNIPVIL